MDNLTRREAMQAATVGVATLGALTGFSTALVAQPIRAEDPDEDPEQKVVKTFMDTCAPLRRILDSDRSRSQGLLKSFDEFVQLVTSSGVAELRDRRAGRIEALGGGHEKSEEVLRRRNQAHKEGLARIDAVRDGLKQFRGEVTKPGYPEGQLTDKILDDFYGKMRQGLVDLDVKPADAVEIDKIFSECVGAVRRGRPQVLADYLEKKLDEFEKARRRPDRGAVENIPIWKAVGIAGFLGFGLWGLFACSIFGDCTPLASASLATLMIISALLVTFC